jgi:DNA repair protein SbcD/Mre11
MATDGLIGMNSKDYPHSIVVIDLDQKDGVKTDLVRTPRPVTFHRVPDVGAAPLDIVEDELCRLELDDPGEHRRPFLEIAFWLDGAEPELRRRIDAALQGKPVRLTRIVRQTAGPGGTLADAVKSGTALDELEPAHVFARRHIEQYGVEPPDDLKQAFNEVLTSILSPDAGRTGAA